MVFYGDKDVGKIPLTMIFAFYGLKIMTTKGPLLCPNLLTLVYFVWRHNKSAVLVTLIFRDAINRRLYRRHAND